MATRAVAVTKSSQPPRPARPLLVSVIRSPSRRPDNWTKTNPGRAWPILPPFLGFGRLEVPPRSFGPSSPHLFRPSGSLQVHRLWSEALGRLWQEWARRLTETAPLSVPGIIMSALRATPPWLLQNVQQALRLRCLPEDARLLGPTKPRTHISFASPYQWETPVQQSWQQTVIGFYFSFSSEATFTTTAPSWASYWFGGSNYTLVSSTTLPRQPLIFLCTTKMDMALASSGNLQHTPEAARHSS